MNRSRSILTSLSVVGGLAAIGICLPMASARAESTAQHEALNEATAAHAALAKGQIKTALEKTERAETTLLNAKAAGEETAPAALDALQSARKAIADRNKPAATSALDAVVSALRSS